MADFSNKRAGNYTLLRKLGDGGFATVYLAQHTVLEKTAAVKLLLQEWVEEADVVSRFFDEARTMESVHEHPNIVKIIDIATMEKCKEEGLPPYFIMEYLEGKSLEDLMKSTDGFSLEQIVGYMHDALSALQFCHDHGVVHRDIKPSNFMIDSEGKVKLTDFGIAKAVQNTSKTGEGLTLGSTDYMSPEQALGKRDLDYRSDIYSLGITLYQLVCDRLPFIADSANAVALKHIQEKAVPPIELIPDMPKRLSNIIMKAIEKDREKRFQSCDEMSKELDKLLDPNIPDEDTAGNDGSKTAQKTISLDLSKLRPEEGDDGYREEEYDEATNYTNMTQKKMASKPPVALVKTLRTLLAIIALTGFFLGLFYTYNKFTQVHFSLKTSPSNARILINNQMVGTSPIDLSLAPAQYVVAFEKDGYITEAKLFNTNARDNIDVDLDLLENTPQELEDFKNLISQFETKMANAPQSEGKTKKDREAFENAQKEIAKSWSSLDAALSEKSPNDIRFGLEYVQFCQKHGQLQRASDLINKLSSEHSSSNLYCLYGMIRQKMGDNNSAFEYYNKALGADSNNKNVLNALADYYYFGKEKEKAKPYLEMSNFLYPGQQSVEEKLEKLK